MLEINESQHFWSYETIQTEIHRQVNDYESFGIPTHGIDRLQLKLPDGIPSEFFKPVVILESFPHNIDYHITLAGINLEQYNPFASHDKDTYTPVQLPAIVWMHDGTTHINESARDASSFLPKNVHPSTLVEVLSLLISHHSHMSLVLKEYGLIIPGSKFLSRGTDNIPYISTWWNGLGIYATSADRAFTDCSCMLTAVPQV